MLPSPSLMKKIISGPIIQGLRQDFGSYIRNVFVLTAVVSLPFALFEQLIFKYASSLEDKTFYGIVGIIASLIELFLIQLILGFGVKKLGVYHRSWIQHIQYYFKHLVIETLRSYAKIAIGILLLILPGIYRYLQYSLVGYVVQFNNSYNEGQIDALEASKRLTKIDFWRYSATLILTHIVIVGIQFHGVRFVLALNPIEWFFNFFFEVFISALFYLLFYQYYKQLSLK